MAKNASKGANKSAAAAAAAAVVEFKLDDNVPIPETSRGERPSKYPWDTMNVGQSFFVPGAKQSTFNTLTAGRTKKYNGERKFISKAVTEDGVEGVRVWRIEPEAKGRKAA
jgi:hypothetical protein